MTSHPAPNRHIVLRLSWDRWYRLPTSHHGTGGEPMAFMGQSVLRETVEGVDCIRIGGQRYANGFSLEITP